VDQRLAVSAAISRGWKPAAAGRPMAAAVAGRNGACRAWSSRSRFTPWPPCPLPMVSWPPWCSRVALTSSWQSSRSGLAAPFGSAGPAAQPRRARWRRAALASSCASGRRPLSTAASMASIASRASAGISTRSAPASRASTAASPAPYCPAIASITRASVTTSPPKPSCSRSRWCSTARERVAGRWGSRAGRVRWPVITASTPAAMAWRKGGSSTCSSRSRLWAWRSPARRWPATPAGRPPPGLRRWPDPPPRRAR